MPRNLILSGSFGVGKKTMAHRIAQGILCKSDAPESRPCGICRSCVQFQRNAHLDFFLITRDAKRKSISIDQIREILSGGLAYQSVAGKNRVVLVENAEKMTPASQNVLLKWLEEKDSNIYFIMTADNERAILPTVISRCFIYRVPAWEEARMRTFLREEGFFGTEAEEAVYLAGGSIGFALELLKNKAYQSAFHFVRSTFLAVRSTSETAQFQGQFKAQKNKETPDHDALDPEICMDLFEREVDCALRCRLENTLGLFEPSHWNKLSKHGLIRISEAVTDAKKYWASNTAWTSIAELLLQTTAEELDACRP